MCRRKSLDPMDTVKQPQKQPSGRWSCVGFARGGHGAGISAGLLPGTARQRAKRLPKAPLAAIQTAALSSADPFARRGYLFFLDHFANDQSTKVFAAALHDPVDFVRNSALHSIACKSCKTGDLCAADVVPALIDVLERDPSQDLRIKSIPFLLRLVDQGGGARAAVERAAHHDSDALVRQAASDGLAGRFVAPRKRYERAERRHARSSAHSGGLQIVGGRLTASRAARTGRAMNAHSSDVLPIDLNQVVPHEDKHRVVAVVEGRPLRVQSPCRALSR